MKQLKKRKLNNKGLSLVEILVTVVILALISAPIVDSFLSAINVNSKARIIQNGTAVAQDTAELFEVFDLQALVDLYKADNVDVKFDNTTGVYTFEKIPMTGADGEEFEVDVKLDPTSYKNGVDKDNNEKIKVNGVGLPVFSGLYGSDCIMLYRQYAGPDETLADLFAPVLDATTLANINKDAVRKLITKSTNVNIECTYDDVTQRYTYAVSVKITYTYNGVTQVTAEKHLEKAYKAEEIHNVYMLCPIFDRYTTDGTGSISGSSYHGTDKIYIDYKYNGAPEHKHNMYFYIAEQDMKNKIDNSRRQSISPKNIYIKCLQQGDADLGYMDYTQYINENKNLKVYTNIGDDYINFNNIYGLTYGDYNTGTSLYEMEVTVRLKGEDDVVTTFNAAK